MKKIITIMLLSPLLQITARDGGTLKIIWSIKNHQMEAGFLFLRFLYLEVNELLACSLDYHHVFRIHLQNGALECKYFNSQCYS